MTPGRIIFVVSLAMVVVVVAAIVEMSDVNVENVGTLFWFGHHNLGLAAGLTSVWSIGSGIILKGRQRCDQPPVRLRWWHIYLVAASVFLSALAWIAGFTLMPRTLMDALSTSHGIVGLALVVFGVASVVSAPCVCGMVGRREIHSNLVSIYIALAVLQVLLGFGRIL